MTATTKAEPVDFDAVHPGDRITFLTSDNGYGADGTPYERTGIVRTKTNKSITVRCESNRLGNTAQITRSTWRRRAVRRVEKPSRLPYAAHTVQYVDHGFSVIAIWVSDPNVSASEAYDNLLRRDLPYEVEVIAEATRFCKSEGAAFSGWVIRTGLDYTDPIKRKREALKHLRDAVAARFTRA